MSKSDRLSGFTVTHTTFFWKPLLKPFSTKILKCSIMDVCDTNFAQFFASLHQGFTKSKLITMFWRCFKKMSKLVKKIRKLRKAIRKSPPCCFILHPLREVSSSHSGKSACSFSAKILVDVGLTFFLHLG